MTEEKASLYDVYHNLNLADSNEAETRLKLIDAILFTLLGWTHSDVVVEEHLSEDGKHQFSDYLLKTATSSLVIEAKKAGSAIFDFPQKRKIRIGELKHHRGYEFILQARDYARGHGVQYAAVTNGAQWFIFPAQRYDNVSFERSIGICFYSISSALRDDFQEFSSLISRASVIDGSLGLHLFGRKEDQFQERRLRFFFSNRGVIHSGNPIYSYIEKEVVTAFSDAAISTNSELLEKCYVKTADRTKYDSQIGMHLQRLSPPITGGIKRPLQKSTHSESGKQALERIAASSRPLALLVLGPVGAGKTTFLQYTRLVTAKHLFDDGSPEAHHPHWIYIDFREFAPEEKVLEFIYSHIRKYFENDPFFSNYEKCVRPSYSSKINHLKRTIWKPILSNPNRLDEKISELLEKEWESSEYIDRLLQYGASKFPILLVFDNIDQIEDDDTQSDIFGNAIAFSHKSGLHVSIVLRDATYVRQKSNATFDAFDFETIYIDPPPVQMVLARRFQLLEHLLKGKPASFLAENGARIQVKDLSELIGLIRSSVLGTRIGAVINALASSDIRLALRMTRQFLESGYSNPGRAIQSIQKRKRYVMPKHEALRSVLLGNQSVYQEELSLIGNPFDAHLNQTNLQLLRLFLMSALVRCSSRADFKSLPGSDIHRHLLKIGVSDEDSLKALSDLSDLRFIRTAGHNSATFSASFYPTRLSGYVVRNLIADMTFLESMMMDTFIADKDAWADMKRISDEIDSERNVVKRINLRTQRVRTFFDYMAQCYEILLREARERVLPSEWCIDPFHEANDLLSRNLTNAEKSADRNYGKAAKVGK